MDPLYLVYQTYYSYRSDRDEVVMKRVFKSDEKAHRFALQWAHQCLLDHFDTKYEVVDEEDEILVQLKQGEEEDEEVDYTLHIHIEPVPSDLTDE